MSTPTAVDPSSTGHPVHENDAALLQRVAQGDQGALAEFYNRYIDAVYRFVYHQVGGNVQDAEDITQETFITAINSIDTFRGESRVYVWLCGIAWRKASDLRRRRDHSKTPQATADEELQQLSASAEETSVEEAIEREALRERIWQVLQALPEHYRQALILKYVEEFKVSEIALIMGKSEKAVESLLVRAREAFKAQLTLEMQTRE